MLIEKIKELMDSDISAYEISKYSGVDASTIQRIRSGKRKVENLTLEIGEKLYEYAVKKDQP